MPPMDLTLKSKIWAENICQSIRQEVDFMSKDTVRFVENQVQNVGTSVKRLVQDILPIDDEQATPVNEKQLSENQRVLNISSSDLLFENKLTTFEDLNCDGNGILSDPTVDSEESFDLSSSLCVDISRDEEEEKETSKIFSSCYSSPKSSFVLDYKSSNFSANDESECQSHVESDGSAYNISTHSDHAFPKAVSDFVCDLPEIEMSRQFETEKTEEFVVCDEDLSMEKVDLCPDTKRDETSLILNGNYVHAAAHGQRNFRYYKKLIQDALASRKRLSKEYEKLGIMFGDINLEVCQQFEPISVPSSTNTFHEMSETEWEIV